MVALSIFRQHLLHHHKIDSLLGLVSVRHCSVYTSNVQKKPSEQKYGYVLSDSGFDKRSKDHEGMVNLGFVNLPSKLKDSLALYYQKHPRKRMTEDGDRLARHLKNRGRPTNSTWTKYKAQVKDKHVERNEVKAFSLEEAIEAGLVSPNALPDGANSVSKTDWKNGSERKTTKRPMLAQYSVIKYGSRETAAYVASQLPTVYAATHRVLMEIKQRLPEYKPQTLLDFGSGSGMTVWSAAEIWNDSIKEYQCVDVSEHMNETAEFLLRGSSEITSPLKIPNVYFKRFLPLSNQIMYDVVVSSFSLTELPFRSQRLQAIKSLWNKTRNFLVIVEPGNNEGFDTTLQARQFLLRSLEENPNMEENQTVEDFDYLFSDSNELDTSDGYIFAPCPHEMTCARTFVETRDHPCNFAQKTEIPFSMRNSSLKRYGYSMENFSYLILRKGRENKSENDQQWTRILQKPKIRQRHVICELCCSNGNIEKHVLTKRKDPSIYKAARHCLNWGDMLPLDEAKRPMNIRKPIHPKRITNNRSDDNRSDGDIL